MKVELFGLCASATRGAVGELNILGLTEIIFVPQFPAVINCCIIAKLRFQSTETGIKEIKISVVDVDGRQICPPWVQNLNVQIQQNASSAIVGLMQNIQNLQIPNAGHYQIGLLVNQREEATLEIQAYQPPQFQRPPPPQPQIPPPETPH